LKNVLITMSVLVVLLVSAPGLTHPEVMVLQKKDNGKDIRVKEGATIELSLEEQGGTGYLWDFNRLDENHFEVVKIETRPPAKEQARVGGPVFKTWWLQVKKAGESQLTLDYFRPWEGRAKAASHYQVKIHIQ
jgi:predicted secreted protein